MGRGVGVGVAPGTGVGVGTGPGVGVTATTHRLVIFEAHALVLPWQSLQSRVVMQCPVVLARPLVDPLWQCSQVPVTAVWLVDAGIQPLVVWHALQFSVVVMCPLVLYRNDAKVTTWQLTQVAVVSLCGNGVLWLAKVCGGIKWQAPHISVIRGTVLCRPLLPLAVMPLWQVKQLPDT